MTYTYALMEVSQDAWDEVAAKLKEAGYDHAFHEGGALDMHGVALVPSGALQRAPESVRKVVEVGRVTTGHGQSDLGVQLLFNFWGEVDFPGLKEGDKLVIEARRPRQDEGV